MKKKNNSKSRKELYEEQPWLHFKKLIRQYAKQKLNTNICASCTELQYLWFACQAWKFKKPCIQRVSLYGGYTIENLTFIDGEPNDR